MMQTILGFIFILHILAVSLVCIRAAWPLTVLRLSVLFGYFWLISVTAAYTLQTFPGLYTPPHVPEQTDDGDPKMEKDEKERLRQEGEIRDEEQERSWDENTEEIPLLRQPKTENPPRPQPKPRP